MDTPKKPQATDGDEVPAPPAPPPAPPLPVRNPLRPLSRRRRQAQPVDPPPAVERPPTSLVFDASPATVAAALAKAGASADEATLAWGTGPEVVVEGEPESQDQPGTVSP